MRLTLLLLYLLFYSLFVYPQSTFRFIKPESDNDIVPHSGSSFYEDSRGFMWVGTNTDGLNRYDGHHFKAYKEFVTKDSLMQNKRIKVIRHIIEDKNNNIWIGTPNELLVYSRDKDIVEFVISGNITGLKLRQNGELLVLKNGKLLEVETVSRKAKPISIKKDFKPHLIEIDNQGNVWLIQNNQKVVIYDSAFKSELFPSFYPKIKQIDVRSIQKGHNNDVWLGDAKGFAYQFDIEKQQVSRISLLPPDTRRTRITGITARKNKEIWMVTSGGMVGKYDVKTNNTQIYIPNETEQSKLCNGSLNAIYTDRSGNIWIGSWAQGIYIYGNRFNAFEHFHKKINTPNSIPSNGITSFSQDKNGKLWIGTEKGLTYQTAKGFQTIPTGQYKHIHCLYTDQQNRTWVTAYQKIGYIENGQFRWLTAQMGYPRSFISSRIRNIVEDKEGNIWFANAKGGLFELNFKTNKIKRFVDKGHKPKNKNTWIGVLKINQLKGKLYLATFNKGISIFDPKTKQFSYIRQNQGSNTNSLSSNHTNDIIVDTKQRVWVSTRHHGFNLLIDEKEGLFKTYTQKDGLISNDILGILEADDGNLWISTNRGISEFDPETETFRNFNKLDGLQENQFVHKAYLKDRNGKLYFGGVNGFNVFHPKAITRNSSPSKVVLTGFKLFNKPVTVGSKDSPLSKNINDIDTLKLNYSQSVFTIEYVSSGLIAQKNVQYAYKLEGIDKDWNYVGNTRFASYNNLPTGKTYTFKVKSTNADGFWNQESKNLTITVTPPWWDTVLCKTMVICFIIISVISFYKIRTYQHKKRQKQLENQVALRTSELATTNEELKQQAEELEQQRDYLSNAYDTIEAKNTLITDSINYAEKIQQAMLPSQQQIAENFQNQFTLFKPKDVVSGDFYWVSQQKNMFFIAVVDCTGHGVPGAFLSMIGSSILNRIVNEMAIYETDKILEHLNNFIRESLRQEEGQNDDGMDLTLCRIEYTSQSKVQIQFTGAKNDIYYCEQNTSQVERIQGDRKSIGGIRTNAKTFTTNNFTINKGDKLYFLTDGIIDQNNKERVRFGRKRWMETLGEMANQPMVHQKQYLETVLDKFKKGCPQRDDITVIGVEV